MYPESIGPGTRFFFFNSLRRSAEINPEAEPVLNAAEQVIFGGPNSLDEKVQNASIMASIENSINFLEQMADFEANNERKVFEQQLFPIINSDPKYASFKNIYKEGEINYPVLLVFINILNQAIEDTKILFHDLKETTTNFNKAAKKIIKGKKYDFTEIERHRGQIVIDARTLASEMGLKVTSEIAEIGASLTRDITNEGKTIEARGRELIEKNVLQMLQNGQTSLQLSSDINTGLISLLMSRLREIASINQEVKGTQNKLEALLNEITISSEKEEEVNTELINYTNELINQINIVETRGKQIQQLINRKQKTVRLQNGRIIGLTADARKKINKFLEVQGKTKIDLNLLVGQKKLESKNILQKDANRVYVEKLKENLGMQNASLEELIVELNQILRSTTQSTRKESITIMTESRSASNLVNLLPENIIKGVVLDALYNGKNDSSLFFLGKAFYNNGLDIDIMSQTLSAELNDFQKIYQNILKNMGKKNITTTFDAKAQTMAVEEMDANFISDIEAELGEQRLTIEQIQDIFFIDSSVKFAETFMADEGGFHGGSLGGDVESQIKNINYMLELGGITPLDAQWLLTATLNAGSGMIGANQRPALENYFSAAAAMLMFRTGGNTIKQWKEQVTQHISKSPTRIHIYTFGTTFVPQSYILKLTAQGLRKCTNLLTEEADSSGSRAHIYNPVSVANIIQNNWERTAEDNYKSVKIELTLLGGFLDILHQMEEIMNSLSF